MNRAIPLVVLLLTGTLWAQPKLIRHTDSAGQTIAVTVPAEMAPLHTRQYYDSDAAALLGAMALPRQKTVKLNVVATTPQAAESARQAIRGEFPADALPAVSVVIGAVPKDGATLGIDAVVATVASEQAIPLLVYISGQAEDGASPAEAAARTIASLKKTLEFADCRVEDIRQAKCFLTPMSAAPQVTAEFAKAFTGLDIRLVFVEWKSKLPIEIELIVATTKPADASAPVIEFLTPPGMKSSALFARVVRINRGASIYLGDIAATAAGNGEAQVLSIFEQLKEMLNRAGGDLRHLVKATYYVSDDDASRQLNEIRPRFYDPARPPAASKAMVPGVGAADRSITIDMIAVPAPKP